MSTIAPRTSQLNTAPRTRAVAEIPTLAARSIELLMQLRGFVRLDMMDARVVVAYLREVSYPRGEVMLRAGDTQSHAHLLLVLEGEVAVDTATLVPGGAVPISVVGPGSVLGEMAVLDGAPRSATCTALSDVQAAGLTQRGLEHLIHEHPRVACKLLVVLAQHMAERLRAVDDLLRLWGEATAPR